MYAVEKLFLKNESGVRRAVACIALTTVFFGLSVIGTDIYERAEEITTVKPLLGVLLAICLMSRKFLLPTLLCTGAVAAFISKIVFGASLFEAVLLPLLATGCVFAVYLWSSRNRNQTRDLRDWQELLKFIAVSFGVSAIAAIPFGAILILGGRANFWDAWNAWVVPTTLSFVNFTPLIVLMATVDLEFLRHRLMRTVFSFMLLGAILLATLVPLPLPSLFLVPCAILLVTMSCEIEGAALALALVQIVFTSSSLAGYPPIAVATLSLGHQLYSIQILCALLAVIMLPVAAAITDRRKLRDQMGATLAALTASERRYRELARQAAASSSAKSEFLANMSHELRTPLNAILGFSEMMTSEIIGPLGHKKYIGYAGDIHKSGKHLLDLINDVLDLSKIDAGKMELRESIFSINRLLEDAVAMVSARASHVELLTNTSKEDIRVEADQKLTKQIVLNLLSNALKFTPSGSVTVKSSINSAGEIEVLVADTGVGMSPDELERALQQYGQVDSQVARQHQGTGLGLPLSKALAELQGGRLVISSARGSGTSVTLNLPAQRLVKERSVA